MYDQHDQAELAFFTARAVISTRIAHSRKLLQPQQLQSDQDHELGPINEVGLPQSPRFHGQSEEPFEAVVAHPHRGSWDASSMKIKRGTNADEHRNACGIAVRYSGNQRLS